MCMCHWWAVWTQLTGRTLTRWNYMLAFVAVVRLQLLYTPQPFYGPFSATTCVRDHPGKPVPEENFWTLWCKGRLNRGRHTDNPAGRHSIWTNQCLPPPSLHFFTGRMPFLPPNQQYKALKATSAFRLGRTLEFSSTVLPAPSLYHMHYM